MPAAGSPTDPGRESTPVATVGTMTDELQHGDRAPAPSRADWADVTRHVHDATACGQRFRLPSLQAAMIVTTVFATALAVGVVSSGGGGPVVTTIALGVASVVCALVGWLRARSSRALVPLKVWTASASPMAALGATERRSLNRQLMGRDPIVPERADFIRGLIMLKRREPGLALNPSLFKKRFVR